MSKPTLDRQKYEQAVDHMIEQIQLYDDGMECLESFTSLSALLEDKSIWPTFMNDLNSFCIDYDKEYSDGETPAVIDHEAVLREVKTQAWNEVQDNMSEEDEDEDSEEDGEDESDEDDSYVEATVQQKASEEQQVAQKLFESGWMRMLRVKPSDTTAHKFLKQLETASAAKKAREFTDKHTKANNSFSGKFSISDRSIIRRANVLAWESVHGTPERPLHLSKQHTVLLIAVLRLVVEEHDNGTGVNFNDSNNPVNSLSPSEVEAFDTSIMYHPDLTPLADSMDLNEMAWFFAEQLAIRSQYKTSPAALTPVEAKVLIGLLKACMDCHKSGELNVNDGAIYKAVISTLSPTEWSELSQQVESYVKTLNPALKDAQQALNNLLAVTGYLSNILRTDATAAIDSPVDIAPNSPCYGPNSPSYEPNSPCYGPNSPSYQESIEEPKQPSPKRKAKSCTPTPPASPKRICV